MNDTAPPASSPIVGMLARFERLNLPLLAPTRALMDTVLSVPAMHARFLNTLALMEHIGSRKIMLSQGADALDQDTLKHLAEEARHAFFFKRQAERQAGQALEFSADDLIGPAMARGYFQRLEATIKRACAADTDPAAVYLYMSMIVEFRAVWAYGLYQQRLDAFGVSLSLAGLLAEEQGHLDEMAARLDAAGSLSDTRVDAFGAAETVLYGRLLDRLSCDVGLAQAA